MSTRQLNIITLLKKRLIPISLILFVIIIIFLINIIFYNVGLKYLPKNANSLKTNQTNSYRFNKILWLIESGDKEIKLTPMNYNLLYLLFNYNQYNNEIPTITAKLLLNSTKNVLIQNIELQNIIFSMSVWISKNWTAEDCLKYISNNSYFGNNFFGINSAAKGYFNKATSELTLEEMAFLISMLKNPEYYDKSKYPERSNEIITDIVNKFKNSKNINSEQR
jgi:hypothetical protein